MAIGRNDPQNHNNTKNLPLVVLSSLRWIDCFGRASRPVLFSAKGAKCDSLGQRPRSHGIMILSAEGAE
ncbi:MAG: hypothetical protein ACR2LM_11765 [Pyrinomonadaceae bacterium]